MANTYFQFKQFRIEQERCAMKVCTDSCLFGAYVPVEKANYILDIGTGTGLLALMAAQRTAATIQAAEIDPAAAQQASENFAKSPWAEQLHLYAGALQDFEQNNGKLFDLIISNPPFYQASLQSPDNARNRAMHTVDLTYTDLLKFCQKFLLQTGSLYLLLPPQEAIHLISLAPSYNLYLQQEQPVFTRESGKHFRSILHLSPQPNLTPAYSAPIYIRTLANEYSEAFKFLLHPYYLNL